MLVLVNIKFKLDINMSVMVTNLGIRFGMWQVGFDDASLALARKSSLKDSSSMKLDLFTLDFAQQNWILCTRDVSLLNCFENVLTNEIIWDSGLFWKKILAFPINLTQFYTSNKKFQKKLRQEFFYFFYFLQNRAKARSSAGWAFINDNGWPKIFYSSPSTLDGFIIW